MKALIQRVKHASVTVDGVTIGEIGHGLLVLLGVGPADDESKADKLLHKVLNYRIFADADGKMNNNLMQAAGGLLVVSQFTLMAETHKGLRPGFSTAAKPDKAEALYDYFVQQARQQCPDDRVHTGSFGADMQVTLQNDGPVTFMLEIE